MSRSRKIIVLSIVLVFVCLSILYFVSRSYPTSFPSEEQLKRKLADSFHRQKPTEITTITDLITIDSKHKVVLFVTDQEQYGKSFWQWEGSRGTWQQIHFSIYETPELWMIDQQDPGSYRLIWHQSPESKVSSYRYYLLKPRNYHISQRNGQNIRNVYYPQYQLEHIAELNGETSGMMSLPEQWIELLQLEQKASNTRSNTVFFQSNQSFSIHYSALDNYNQYIPEIDLSKGPSFANGGSEAKVLTYPVDHLLDSKY